MIFVATFAVLNHYWTWLIIERETFTVNSWLASQDSWVHVKYPKPIENIARGGELKHNCTETLLSICTFLDWPHTQAYISVYLIVLNSVILSSPLAAKLLTGRRPGKDHTDNLLPEPIKCSPHDEVCCAKLSVHYLRWLMKLSPVTNPRFLNIIGLRKDEWFGRLNFSSFPDLKWPTGAGYVQDKSWPQFNRGLIASGGKLSSSRLNVGPHVKFPREFYNPICAILGWSQYPVVSFQV